MIRELIKSVYYFIYQIFLSRYFLIKIIYFNQIIVFDKKKLNFFLQSIRNRDDLNTLRQIFIKEEYKFEKKINDVIYSNYENIIKNEKIPLILDCGANICASANYFYLSFPKAEITGIEPDQINFNLCKKNNLNSKKIKILNKAISNERFNYSLKRKNHYGRSSFIKYNKDSSGKKKISRTIIMKDVIQNYTMYKYSPFLIKIDIEGHEKKFFESNTDWMKYFKIIIIELHDWMLPNENISSTFFRALKDNLTNYEIYNYGENTVVINKSKQ